MCGDEVVSFDAVYAAEREGLVRLASLILGSTFAADDVVQDAFARLLGRFGRVTNPAGWLRVAVVNGCRNEHRRLRVSRRHAQGLDTVGPVAPDTTPELIGLLRHLPTRQRAVVVLRFYEDLPEAEIARLMRIRVGTVKSTLHRALARLRKEAGE